MLRDGTGMDAPALFHLGALPGVRQLRAGAHRGLAEITTWSLTFVQLSAEGSLPCTHKAPYKGLEGITKESFDLLFPLGWGTPKGVPFRVTSCVSPALLLILKVSRT